MKTYKITLLQHTDLSFFTLGVFCSLIILQTDLYVFIILGVLDNLIILQTDLYVFIILGVLDNLIILQCLNTQIYMFLLLYEYLIT